ncbi:hypothetical protein MXB_440 [Myxobolus squamalis]|nr:hypothetical protein MXB_440 [Myxobolus squamalis]
MKFLYEPFSVESSILSTLSDHLNAEITSKSIIPMMDIYIYIYKTYFGSCQLSKNSFYYLKNTLSSKYDIEKFIATILIEAIKTLVNAGCVLFKNEDLEPKILGKITSHYYLSHKPLKCSMKNFLRIVLFAKITFLYHHNTDYSSPRIKIFFCKSVSVGLSCPLKIIIPTSSQLSSRLLDLIR